MISKETIIKNKKALTEETGCYIYFLIERNRIVYVGQTTQGIRRVVNHLNSKKFDSYYMLKCEEEELDDLEALYINEHTPIYNRTYTNNSSKYVSLNKLKKILMLDGDIYNLLKRECGLKPLKTDIFDVAEAEKIIEQAIKDGILAYGNRSNYTIYEYGNRGYRTKTKEEALEKYNENINEKERNRIARAEEIERQNQAYLRGGHDYFTFKRDGLLFSLVEGVSHE